MKIDAIGEIGSAQEIAESVKIPAVTEGPAIEPVVVPTKETKISPNDQFLLSKEAKAFWEAQKLAEEKRDSTDKKNKELQKQLDSANKLAETQLEEAEKLRKCMLIAIRMMGGNSVPLGDQRYLKENNFDMYKQAVSLGVSSTNSNPRKYSSVLSDEDKEKLTYDERITPEILNAAYGKKYEDNPDFTKDNKPDNKAE